MKTSNAPENSNSEKNSVTEQSVTDVPANNDRRKVLKKLAIGTAAVAGCSVLPNKWTSPIVEFGALPAHAVTSGTPVAAAEPAPEPTAAGDTREEGLYWGRHNGNRPTWYFSKPMRDYPQQFTVVVDGCATVNITSHNGYRYVEGSTIVKQSDVSGRGLVVVASAGCYSKTAHIIY